ncbi:MAG: ATP-dependent DNA ligase, partial [Calditrichaeota bacterium]
LKSRNNKNLNIPYPEVAEAISELKPDNFIIDGEIVAFEGDKTSFSRLQGRMQLEDEEEARASGVAVYYYIFDILHLGDYDLTKLPLRARKSILKKAVSYNDPLRFTTHRNEKGEKFYHEACRKGWEGLIAKDAHSTYVHSRSGKWLKFKCVNQQEFVIGGYTEPQGERLGFGALLIGYYDDDQNFRYAGKVGTGFDDETLKKLKGKMENRERKTCPFQNEQEISREETHWVTPALVAEIGFTEWTEDNKLRHPRYLGLRRDKDPEDVHSEQ